MVIKFQLVVIITHTKEKDKDMKRPMVYVFAFVFIGIMFGQYFPQREGIALFGFSTLFLAIIIALYHKLFGCILLPCASMLGFVAMVCALPSPNPNITDFINNNSVVFVEGKVCAVSGGYDNNSHIIVKCRKIFDDNITEDVNFKIHAYTQNTPDVGQNVVLMGKLYAINGKKNISDNDISIYYGARKIRYGMDIVKTTNLELDKDIGYYAFKIKNKLADVYTKILPEEESSLMQAIILGDSSQIDDEIYTNLANAGIVHIVAVSGLHIGIFASLIAFFTKRLNRVISFAITLAVLSFYFVLTGFGISSERALLMMAVLMLGKLLHKDYDIVSSACTTAVIILLISPFYIYDMGFQYSFCTVVGIGLMYDFFRKYNVNNSILQTIGISVAAGLSGKPIGILHSYKISLVDIFANLLITGLITIIFISGLVGGIIGLINITAGKFIVSAAYALLKYILFISKMFAGLKFENIAVGNCSFGGIIFIYILMICVYNIIMRDEKDDGYTLALPVIIASLLCSSIKNKIEINPDVYFLDMGRSESCVLTYENRCYVLNGGSTIYKNNGTKTLLPYLYYKGYNRIDGVFLSDTREMNIGGILQIMDKIKIDRIYIPSSAEHNRYYYELIELAKKYKIEIVYLNDDNYDEIDENTMFNYITGEQNETN